MRVSFCLIAYNEALTLRACLAHLYPHAHEIIVCEGSIELLRAALGLATRSDDGTCEILRSFPDPAGKLRILQRDWRDKDAMAAAYAAAATGDLIWHVDADEFYDDYALQTVPREFQDPSLLTLNIPMLVFWKSPEWLLETETGERRWFRFARVLRRTAGMSVKHIPVRRILDGAIDETGMRDPRDPRIMAWHYAWNDDARVRTKMQLYSTRDARSTRPDWVRDVWDRWTPDDADSRWPDGVHPSRSLRLWPRRYDGDHPRAVRGILNRLNALQPVEGKA